MSTVNVRVAHDYDVAIAQFRHVKVLANTNADGCDDVFYLLVGEHFVETGTLHIQDFSS